jgi:hypothetical protein
MFARLEVQNGDHDSAPMNRGSVDGHHKLQEEFVRLHKEKEEEERNVVNGSIDWGTLMIRICVLSSDTNIFFPKISGGQSCQARLLNFLLPKYNFLTRFFQTTKDSHLNNQRNWLKQFRLAFRELFAE